MSSLPQLREHADPVSDPVFLEIAELAAQLCGAGHAAITLHRGAEHVALATSGGLPMSRMPLDSRFCCEVLHSGGPLEVSDAHFDLRYHDDPLVTAGPRIRFYSGVPLAADSGRCSASRGTTRAARPRAFPGSASTCRA